MSRQRVTEPVGGSGGGGMAESPPAGRRSRLLGSPIRPSAATEAGNNLRRLTGSRAARRTTGSRPPAPLQGLDSCCCALSVDQRQYKSAQATGTGLHAGGGNGGGDVATVLRERLPLLCIAHRCFPRKPFTVL